jgi:cysteine desulfurase
MNNLYYFDYNSTHPPFAEVLRSSLDGYLENFCNPSGPTRFSLQRQRVIENARAFFAEFCQKDSKGFVFSSTGTEAIYFLVHAIAGTGKWKKMVVSPFEHPAMYAALNFFGIEAIELKTDKTGIVSIEHLESILQNEPTAVCIIYVNNETGVIQPLDSIYTITQKYKVPLFSDLMQGFCKIPLDFSKLNGFVFSGHKIGAGVGASCTYLDDQFLLKNSGMFYGGNQENSHRAGTENTFAIQNFFLASQKISSQIEYNREKIKEFQKQVENCLRSIDAEIVAKNSDRIASTSFAILPIDDIEFFMMGLEECGIIVSNGSSCKSRVREAPKSLLAMGYSKEEALRAIRISTGVFTTRAEIVYLIENLVRIVGLLKNG